MRDVLELSGLEVSCIIGDLPEEREREQVLRLDVGLELDLSVAGRSDRLEDTVDYAALAGEIDGALKAGRYSMIEAAAERVAEVVLGDGRVRGVRVRVEKRGAVAGLAAAVVKIRRERSEGVA